MRVAIDLSSAVTGGGITYAKAMLPRLAAEKDIELGPILVRPDVPAAVVAAEPYGVVAVAGRYSALSGKWRSALRSARPDAVLVPTEVSFGRYAVPVVQAIRNPTLDPANLHEYPAAERLRKVVYRFLARRSARMASAYIAVSEYASLLGTRFLRVPPERITIAYHGAPDPIPLRAEGPIRNFLFVSNLYRYKNVHRLISALAQVESDWRLTIAGKELARGYLAELRRLLQETGAGDRVSFLGGVSTEHLDRLYSESDCLVWPSYAETFGFPLLEARAHGLPIIAADAASNREVAGDAAVYFDPFDINALTGLLKRATTEGVMVGDLPRRYTWDTSAAIHADVLRRVAGVAA